MEGALPPEQVRVVALQAETWPEDARKVRVALQITPFLERPDIETALLEKDGNEISSLSIVETIDDRMTFTMHIRGSGGNGPYRLRASLLYPNIGTVDERSIEVPLSPGTG